MNRDDDRIEGLGLHHEADGQRDMLELHLRDPALPGWSDLAPVRTAGGPDHMLSVLQGTDCRRQVTARQRTKNFARVEDKHC